MTSDKLLTVGRTDGVQNSHSAALWAVLRTALAVSVLSFYLLPNTIWARLSPGMLVVHLTETTSYELGYVLVGLLGVVVPLIFFLLQSHAEKRDPLVGRLTVPLWLPTAGYMAPMVYTLGLYREHPTLAASVGAMLMAFVAGITGAMVAGTARRAIDALLVIATIQGAYALYYQNHGINELLSGNVARAGGTFNDPNGVYVLMLLVVPLAITLAACTTSALFRLFFMVACSVTLATFLVTWYRGGMLGLVVCLAWLGFCQFTDAKHRIFIVITAVALLGGVCFHRADGAVNSASASRSVAGRTLLWRKGLVIFRNNWLAGTGVGVLEIPTRTPTRDSRRMALEVQDEPKNLVIDWLDEFGISGGLLLVLFMVGLRNRLRFASGTDEAVAISAAWLGLLVAGMFDTPFGTPFRYHANALVGCLFGATCMLAPRRSAAPTENQHCVEDPIKARSC